MGSVFDRQKERIQALNLAQAILDAENELIDLRREVARLHQVEVKYNKLLSDTIRHSDAMICGIIDMHTALAERKEQ